MTNNKELHISNRIRHERGYVYNFHFHIVWTTKYRAKIFNSKNDVSDMKQILSKIATDNDITIENIEVMPDHVHLLVTFKPKYAPANVVKAFKGISARAWFKQRPETKSQLWGGHLWTSSYYMSTLGDMSQETVTHYIENQRTEKATSGRPKLISRH